MLGLTNMGNNLERNIYIKSQISKKNIKELRELIGKVYIFARNNNTNKLMFIKRNVDKLNIVSNYLNNLKFPDQKKLKRSSFDKDIHDLYQDTVKSMDKMTKLFKKQKSTEKKDLQHNGKFCLDQQNLDNLRLAQNHIKQIETGFNLSKYEWAEIEQS